MPIKIHAVGEKNEKGKFQASGFFKIIIYQLFTMKNVANNLVCIFCSPFWCNNLHINLGFEEWCNLTLVFKDGRHSTLYYDWSSISPWSAYIAGSKGQIQVYIENDFRSKIFLDTMLLLESNQIPKTFQLCQIC